MNNDKPMRVRTLIFTPQQIDEWRLWMDGRRLERGEHVAHDPSILTMGPAPMGRAGRVAVGVGSYRTMAHLKLH